MSKHRKPPTIEEILADLRAKGVSEAVIDDVDRKARDLIALAVEHAKGLSGEAREAHIQWLWTGTAHPDTRPARAGRLRQGRERAVCTVEYHTHGRLVRCLVAGVQRHADVVETFDGMKQTLIERYARLVGEKNWEGSFTPRGWMRIVRQRRLAAYRASALPRKPRTAGRTTAQENAAAE